MDGIIGAEVEIQDVKMVHWYLFDLLYSLYTIYSSNGKKKNCYVHICHNIVVGSSSPVRNPVTPVSFRLLTHSIGVLHRRLYCLLSSCLSNS